MDDNNCEYDANGNITCWVKDGVKYIQSYNVENRMSGVKIVSGSCGTPGTPTEEWRFKYDSDGVRVMEEYLLNGASTHHRYFYAGGSSG